MMKQKKLKLVFVSTPIGYLGSGKGGGVELTLVSLIKGLLTMGNEIVLVAPHGSVLPDACKEVKIHHVKGLDQLSWQHQKFSSPEKIAPNSVLPKLWEEALNIGEHADAILNFGYDWLPLWLTPRVRPKLFHLISMGGVSQLLKEQIKELDKSHHYRLAFHTLRQSSDYEIVENPIIVGNGFDLKNYNFQKLKDGPLGWAGRVAPEKGLEDAVAVASELKDTLYVWGLIEDNEYAKRIENNFPAGTINWRGFLNTVDFQKELGRCRALINTPKWNEAYGNVIVESMACGVPVIAYNRGGPGELINHSVTGWLVEPDNIKELIYFTKKVQEIDRKQCRFWVEKSASCEAFAIKVYSWLLEGIHKKDN